MSRHNLYRVFVLHTELPDKYIEQLENMSSNQLCVECVDVSEKIASKSATLHTRAHFSQETYFRFVIPEILPAFDKVLYLDSDLVVETDVENLLSVDIGNNFIGAIQNLTTSKGAERIYSDLGINPIGYINAGVLIINVKEWLVNDVERKCFTMLREMPKEQLLLLDQDILNKVCEGKIYTLPTTYNFYWHMLHGSDEFVEVCKEAVQKYHTDIKILHFASNIKPWNKPELQLADRFWQYARKTVFYEEILFKSLVEINNLLCHKRIAEVNNKISAIDSKFRNAINNVNLIEKHLQEVIVQRDTFKQEIYNIKSGLSFKIGRIITWLPRKILGRK